VTLKRLEAGKGTSEYNSLRRAFSDGIERYMFLREKSYVILPLRGITLRWLGRRPGGYQKKLYGNEKASARPLGVEERKFRGEIENDGGVATSSGLLCEGMKNAARRVGGSPGGKLCLGESGGTTAAEEKKGGSRITFW